MTQQQNSQQIQYFLFNGNRIKLKGQYVKIQMQVATDFPDSYTEILIVTSWLVYKQENT